MIQSQPRTVEAVELSDDDRDPAIRRQDDDGPTLEVVDDHDDARGNSNDTAGDGDNTLGDDGTSGGDNTADNTNTGGDTDDGDTTD